MSERDWWSVVTYASGAVIGMWMFRRYNIGYTAGAAIALAARAAACLIVNHLAR